MRNTPSRLPLVLAVPALFVVSTGCKTNFDGLDDASIASSDGSNIDLPRGSGGSSGTGGMTGSGGREEGGSGGSATGSGGHAPGSGGTASGSGGHASGTGGSVMGSGGSAPGSGGNAPGSGGSASGSGGASGCGPENCTGCCSGDTCIADSTPAHCGAAGAACQTCGQCESCTAGACRIRPTSSWTVTCASAQLTEARPEGGLWDPAGANEAPDPRCVLTSAGNSIESSTDAGPWPYGGTYTPDWTAIGMSAATATMTASALMATGWTAAVVDCDGLNCQTKVEACTSDRPATEDELRAGAYTLSNVGGCIQLNVHLSCVPTPNPLAARAKRP